MEMTEEEMDEQLELERKLESNSNGLFKNLVDAGLAGPNENIDPDCSYTEEKLEKIKDSSCSKEIIEEDPNIIRSLGEVDLAGPNEVDSNWPKVGDVYAIKFSDIKSAAISRESKFDISRFQWFVSTSSLVQYDPDVRSLNSKIGNRYTLLKYEGGREFVEFFTGTTIRLYEKNKSDVESFIKEVNLSKINPLMVNLDDLTKIDDNIKSDIVSCNEEFISTYINNLVDSSIECFNSQYNIVWQEDYKNAKVENNIYDFIKIKK